MIMFAIINIYLCKPKIKIIPKCPLEYNHLIINKLSFYFLMDTIRKYKL